LRVLGYSETGQESANGKPNSILSAARLALSNQVMSALPTLRFFKVLKDFL